MERILLDKVIVITGGASGIGYEIAVSYLKKGAKVTILLDINEEEGNKAVKTLNSKYGENKAVFYKCDVTTDLEDVSKKIFATYKYVDVLVNNAGILNEMNIKKTIDINVTAFIEWSFKFWDHMNNSKGGRGGTIINLASIFGYRVVQYVPVYQASKFAVMGFTRSLGHNYNYKRSGVRVVAICPGFTETNMTATRTTRDSQTENDYSVYSKGVDWQKVEVVGKAAVDVFERAESGTAWLIEGGRPIVEVVENKIRSNL